MRSILLHVASTALLTPVLLSGCSQSYADRVISVGPNELTIADEPDGLLKTHEIAPDAEIVIDGKPAELADIQPGYAVRVVTQVQGNHEVAVQVDAARGQTEDAIDTQRDVDTPLTPPLLLPIPGETQGLSTPEENQGGREGDKPAKSSEDDPKPSKDQQATAPSPEDGAKVIFHGKIDLVRPHFLRMHADADTAQLTTEITITVTADTEILVGGVPASPGDLAEGMVVTVIAAKNGDHVIAERIEAELMPA